MKLAVLGNSHIACLKVAWNDMQHDHTLTFFGSHGLSLASLRYQNGKLSSDEPRVRNNFRMSSEGNAEEIILSDYDALLIHGLADIGVAATVFKHYSLKRGGLMLSQATFQSVLDGWYHSQLLALTVPQIPIGVRCIVTTTSAYAELIAKWPDWRYVGDIPANCRAAFDYTLVAYSKFQVVRQPLDTLKAPFLTRDEFSKNSVRLTADLNVPHPDDDYTHMNADYGRLVLRDVFRALDIPA